MMTKRSLFSIVVIGALFIQCIYAQQKARGPRATKLVVEIAIESPSRQLHFKVDQQQVPNDDLLSYLVEHEEKYGDNAVPYVIVPSSLTIQEVGAIDATLNKAGYHKMRFFLSATNSDFAVEMVFEPQVPLKSIWEK